MTANSTVLDLGQYQFDPNDSLLVDANVWLYIHCPHARLPQRIIDAYSTALKRILSAGSRMFIDVLVLSEFVNRYARLVHGVTPPGRHKNFKKFRDSPDFKPVARAIADACQRIMQSCERIESGLPSIDVGALLTAYARGDSDFNDLVLAELCKAKGLKLVTHDSDFKGHNITLLTAHPKLLKQ